MLELKTFKGKSRYDKGNIAQDIRLKKDRQQTQQLAFISLFGRVQTRPTRLSFHLFITGLSLELTLLTSFPRQDFPQIYSKKGFRFDIQCLIFFLRGIGISILFSRCSTPRLFNCAKACTVKLHGNCSALYPIVGANQ